MAKSPKDLRNVSHQDLLNQGFIHFVSENKDFLKFFIRKILTSLFYYLTPGLMQGNRKNSVYRIALTFQFLLVYLTQNVTRGSRLRVRYINENLGVSDSLFIEV